jgi:hypothetical protein
MTKSVRGLQRRGYEKVTIIVNLRDEEEVGDKEFGDTYRIEKFGARHRISREDGRDPSLRSG